MPLMPGKTRSVISANIKELMKPSANAPEGRPNKQAVAIALKKAGKAKRPSTPLSHREFARTK